MRIVEEIDVAARPDMWIEPCTTDRARAGKRVNELFDLSAAPAAPGAARTPKPTA